jgi:hypothetical protein
LNIIFVAEVGQLGKGTGDVFGDLWEAGVGECDVFWPEVAIWEVVGCGYVELMIPEYPIFFGAGLLGAAAVFAVLVVEDICAAVVLLVW